MEYDFVIRGGTIADGRGGKTFEADVAVSDGKIAAVGKVGGRGREEIDAKGKLVTPGFVDVHTHYDGQATWDTRLQPSSWHGVTTAVFGNCGVGFAPVKRENRERLIELMEGVEDIPAPVLTEGLKWDWASFGDYLDALDRRSHDMDICAQVPHAALRVHVMGERASRLEPATADDIAQMRALAADGIRAGAFGFSTSKSLNHQTKAGEPTPTKHATEEELVGIAMGLKDAGRGVLQLTSAFTADTRAAEFAMYKRMAKESGRPLSMLVLQRHDDPDGWRDLMDGIEAARAEGIQMTGQIAPRAISTIFGLEMTRHPFCLHPSFKAIENEPLERKVAAMRDPAFRARVLGEKATHTNVRTTARVGVFDRMFPLGDPVDYEPPAENSISAIAARRGVSPEEVAYDLMLENDGRGWIFSPATNYAAYNLDVCEEMIRSPYTVLGLSDGGAHVQHISDGSFPTFLLSYWGRDRKRGTVDIGWLVHWMTGATAKSVGLLDRGVIAPGYKADINVIDFDRLRTHNPYLKYDLPLGGKRMLQHADGYEATMVSGAVTYREGEAMGPLPGRLVRGQQPCASPLIAIEEIHVEGFSPEA